MSGALFKMSANLTPGRGSEGSRHLDILLNLLIKSFRMQKCGKQYFPRKSGLTGPLFHALYEQKILTKLLDDTAALLVRAIHCPATSLGIDNLINTAVADHGVRLVGGIKASKGTVVDIISKKMARVTDNPARGTTDERKVRDDIVGEIAKIDIRSEARKKSNAPLAGGLVDIDCLDGVMVKTVLIQPDVLAVEVVAAAIG